MGEKGLKPGWKRVKFGDVVRLCNERSAEPASEGIERFVGLEHLEPGDLRIRSWGDVSEGTTFTNRFRAGQVLFGKRRAYQRKLAVADFDGVCSGDIYVFESKNAELIPQMLPFICQTSRFFEHAINTSAGSLSPRTNWKDLADFELFLPERNEQERLLSVLSAWETGLQAIRDARQRMLSCQRSLREELLTTLSQDELLPLVEVVQSSAYGPRFPATAYGQKGNVKSIRTTDMPEYGVITTETVPAATVPAGMAAEHRLHPGDFLVSRTGFTSGRCAVFRGAPDSDKFVYIPAAFLIRIRLRQERVLPDFILEFFQSSVGQQIVRRMQRGTQQLNISASTLLQQRVACPSMKKQMATLEQLRHAQDACSALKQRVAQMELNATSWRERHVGG